MKIIYILFLSLCPFILSAQQFVANYDEAKIPAYTLPDPLIFNNGTKVITKKDWEKRREELLKVFEKEVYGIIPEWHGTMRATLVSQKENALNGLALRKEVRLELSDNGKTLPVMLLIYLPINKKKVPVILGYNFDGNHTVSDEPDILLPTSWVSNNNFGISDNKASEKERGSSVSRWPLKEIIEEGFGLATAYYGDIDPDFKDGFKDGVHSLFTAKRDSSSWASVAAWAWGLSRLLDYLETEKTVDAKKVIVMGHSRLGKAAIWAAVKDPRFAMCISNNSGCSGAALSKRIFGETVGRINNSFPHWFCDNYKKYSLNEDKMPVDQHELLALIAPRPLYVASAQDDLWADPKGEFLSCVYASPVYELLGLKGFPVKEIPALNKPVFGSIAYHIRPGKHDVTLYDWKCYMEFAQKALNLTTGKN